MKGKRGLMDHLSFYQEHVQGLRPDGKNNYRGHCPFPDGHSGGIDKHPSFSVNVRTGQYQCFSCGAKGNLASFCQAKGIPFPGQTKKQEPEAVFDYVDEKGILLLQVCRFPGKKFSQRRPDGAGGWKWSVKDVRKVPYRLPELIKADPGKWVFVPEGEKHVDRLYSLGLMATCNVGGAGKWTKELSPYLKGRKVCILPDNDPPGQEHGLKTAQNLHGITAEIRILNLPGLKDKGDIINWLDGDQKSDDVKHTTDELLGLLGEVKTWKPDKRQDITVKRPVIRTAEELFNMELPEVKYIVEGIFPQGLTIFAGKPKIGKSWFILHVSLAVCLGGLALGKIKVEKGDVLYLALEDTDRRLKDRMENLLSGAKPPNNFHYCCKDWGRFPEAGIWIEEFIEEHEDTRLVVVDTLQKIRAPSPKGAGVYESDYKAIEDLKAIADKYNIAVVAVTHQRKATSPDDIFDTITGSLGLTGSADTNIILRKEARTRADGILHITSRVIEDQELALSFSSGLWQIEGGAEEYRVSKERIEVIELLKKAEDPMTPAGISKVLGKKQGTIRKLLKSMVDNSQVSVNTDGKYIIAEKKIIEGEI